MFTLHSNAPAASLRTSRSRCETELAWEALYRQHQAHLIGFACRRGCDEHEARDVVQELFLRLFRRGTQARISTFPEEGQRAWLTRTLRWIICNRHRDRAALKRGSSQVVESLDDLLGQGLEIPSAGTPATEHDRRWAMAVVERGLAKLRADMKPGAWAGFESNLWGQDVPRTPAMRVASHRARQRLREIILRESNQATLYQAASGDN